MKFYNVFPLMLMTMSLSLPLQAETGAAEEHQHSHEQHASSSLQLNQGKKWQTDAPLRQGMQGINEKVMNTKSAFHAATLTASDAKTLTRHIQQQIEYIITNCKLEPMADSTLHVLISEMLQGAEVLEKEPLSTEGLPRIIKALNTYPEYFNHPDWAVKH